MPTSSRDLTELPQCIEWDGGNNISSFNRARKYSTPARDDVGIVPYKETWDAFHSTGGTPSVSLALDSSPSGGAETLVPRSAGGWPSEREVRGCGAGWLLPAQNLHRSLLASPGGKLARPNGA